jgi:hypothetical protein
MALKPLKKFLEENKDSSLQQVKIKYETYKNNFNFKLFQELFKFSNQDYFVLKYQQLDQKLTQKLPENEINLDPNHLQTNCFLLENIASTPNEVPVPQDSILKYSINKNLLFTYWIIFDKNISLNLDLLPNNLLHLNPVILDKITLAHSKISHLFSKPSRLVHDFSQARFLCDFLDEECGFPGRGLKYVESL